MPSRKPSVPSPLTAGLQRRIYDTLRLVESRDIEGDESCRICHRPYLNGTNSEAPAQLPCGHLFGFGCIMTWFSEHDRSTKCPTCGDSIFEDGGEHGAAFWLSELKEFPPHQPLDNDSLKGAGLMWAERAENLFRDFCEDMIRFVIYQSFHHNLYRSHIENTPIGKHLFNFPTILTKMSDAITARLLEVLVLISGKTQIARGRR